MRQRSAFLRGLGAGTHLLIRACVDRCLEAAITRSLTKWKKSRQRRTSHQCQRQQRQSGSSRIKIRYRKLQVLTRIGKRGKIEVPQILRSGCKAKEPKFRTAQRLANLISGLLHSELA